MMEIFLEKLSRVGITLPHSPLHSMTNIESDTLKFA